MTWRASKLNNPITLVRDGTIKMTALEISGFPHEIYVVGLGYG
jgi:hypothetical protein